MTHPRCRHDSAQPQDAGREFTSDDADLLCAECLMSNRGIVEGATFKMQIWNKADYFRVVVTTAEEETDLEFWKLYGVTKFWRDGIGGAEWN